MSAPYAPPPVTFSEALATRATPETRIDQIAKQLGDIQGKQFLAALQDPTIQIMRLQAALKDVGIRVSHSTLGTYRRGYLGE